LAQLIGEKTQQNLTTRDLLKEQWVALFAIRSERFYLKYSLKQLQDLQNTIKDKKLCQSNQRDERRFLTLNAKDFYAVAKLVLDLGVSILPSTKVKSSRD